MNATVLLNQQVQQDIATGNLQIRLTHQQKAPEDPFPPDFPYGPVGA